MSEFDTAPTVFARDPESTLAAAGGWCAPSDLVYNFLAEPKPLTKKQLRENLAIVQRALDRERKARRKLEKRNRRLLKVIERLS